MHNLFEKKANKYSLLFSGICFLIFVGSMFVNRSYFEAIAYDSVFFYQLRQFTAVLLLFVIGLIFLQSIRNTLSCSWITIFAFPVGVCLWVFASMFLLLLGISYTFGLTLLLIAVLLAGCLLYQRRSTFSHPLFEDIHEMLPFLALFLGFAFLASSGLVYSFVSYDSYFYFTNYGHTLTIVKSFQYIVGENSFTLTNISQFLPLINSYTAFWGLDQAFQIQTFFIYNIITAFFYGLYQYVSMKTTVTSDTPLLSKHKKRVLLYCILFTLLLASSTSFIVVSGWTLANMYCMVYIFFLFMASFLVSHFKTARKESLLLIGLCFVALTLLRKDGIIFVAFFLICFCSIELFPKKQLAIMFLPSALAEIWWLYYVRVVLSPDVSQGVYSSIANNKNIFFVACIIVGSFLYLSIGHPILRWIEKRAPFITEYYLAFMGFMVLFGYSFRAKGEIIIDNVDYTIRNIFHYPSSWGISALFFGILIAFSLIKEFKLDYLQFFWSGFAFLNLVSYCIVDNKLFWVNWDDSYNRVLLQIVPVFIFIMAVKILPLLQSDTPNHNSES